MGNRQVKALDADTSIATTDVVPVQAATGDMKKITGSNVKASLESGGGIALSLAAAQVAAAGSDTQVQYSNAGVTAGDADMIWNDSAKILRIGASTATARIRLPSSNDAATPTLSFGDGDTGLYESAADTLAVAIGGTARWEIDSTGLASDNANGPILASEAPSSTNPTLIPNKSDMDTGIGHAAADQLSVIAGGVEIARFVEDTEDFACFRVDDDIVTDNLVPTSFVAMYMNESGDLLTFKVRYANGSTIKTGTVAVS